MTIRKIFFETLTALFMKIQALWYMWYMITLRRWYSYWCYFLPGSQSERICIAMGSILCTYILSGVLELIINRQSSCRGDNVRKITLSLQREQCDGSKHIYCQYTCPLRAVETLPCHSRPGGLPYPLNTLVSPKGVLP
jgi:hypothetical protein